MAGLTRAIFTIESAIPVLNTQSLTPNSVLDNHATDDSNITHDTANEFIFDPGQSDFPNPQAETVTVDQPASDPVSGGISSRGRQRKLSRTMQQSIAQKDFYGNQGMHYMAASATD